MPTETEVAALADAAREVLYCHGAIKESYYGYTGTPEQVEAWRKRVAAAWQALTVAVAPFPQ